jgi:hypothetical protein
MGLIAVVDGGVGMLSGIAGIYVEALGNIGVIIVIVIGGVVVRVWFFDG